MIYFNNRRSACDCVIRDFSQQGARLVFASLVSVPHVIDLYIPQTQQTMSARVTWRRGEEIGITFNQLVANKDQLIEAADLAERVTRLESEIEALKGELEMLGINAQL